MMTMPENGVRNGIPTYTNDRTGICAGTLIFGVGFRNEPATISGITHLVEHVVPYMVEHLPLSLGGVVDQDSVKFHATGDAEAVAEFLNAIAGAISDFPAFPMKYSLTRNRSSARKTHRPFAQSPAEC